MPKMPKMPKMPNDNYRDPMCAPIQHSNSKWISGGAAREYRLSLLPHGATSLTEKGYDAGYEHGKHAKILEIQREVDALAKRKKFKSVG